MKMILFFLILSLFAFNTVVAVTTHEPLNTAAALVLFASLVGMVARRTIR